SPLPTVDVAPLRTDSQRGVGKSPPRPPDIDELLRAAVGARRVNVPHARGVGGVKHRLTMLPHGLDRTIAAKVRVAARRHVGRPAECGEAKPEAAYRQTGSSQARLRHGRSGRRGHRGPRLVHTPLRSMPTSAQPGEARRKYTRTGVHASYCGWTARPVTDRKPSRASGSATGESTAPATPIADSPIWVSAPVALSNRSHLIWYPPRGSAATPAATAAFSNDRRPADDSAKFTSGWTAIRYAAPILSRRCIRTSARYCSAAGSLNPAVCTSARIMSSLNAITRLAAQNRSSGCAWRNEAVGTRGFHVTGSKTTPSNRPTAGLSA